MDIEDLINKYYKLIYKICFNMLLDSYEAQDATQETYILIHKNIYKYKKLSDNELKNVICAIALNKCKDILRKRKTTIKIVECDKEDFIKYPDNIDIEVALVEKEKKLHIKKMINELKSPYNEILYKYYIEEKALDIISTQMHIPKTTLKVQIYRGKKMLKQNIIKGGDLL